MCVLTDNVNLQHCSSGDVNGKCTTSFSSGKLYVFQRISTPPIDKMLNMPLF